MEKKKYIAPEISIYAMSPLCGNIAVASVYQGSTSGDLIENIDVKDADETEDDWFSTTNWGN